jgi:lipoprotein-releasing system permease protein
LATHTHRAYIWWLAWRSFSARRRRGGLSFMTTISILGVTIGVGALVLVLSVMGGFEQDLRRKMLVGEPHLEILAENAVAGFSMKQWPLESFKGAFPEAVHLEPFVSADVVLKRKNFIAAATMIGVRPEMENSKMWAFDGTFTEGDFKDISKIQKPKLPQNIDVYRDLPGIALGDKIATVIGADVGDEVTLLSPQASASAALSGGTLTRNYVVVGKFSTGLFNYDDKWAVVGLDEGRYFLPEYDPSLSDEQYVTGVAMTVKDPTDMGYLKERMTKFPGLKPHSWQDTHAALLGALRLEKFTMGAILMMIVSVAAFSICGTMMMTISNKKTEVSVLRSLGMGRDQILQLFLVNGFVVGTSGVFFGLVGGLALCATIKYSKWFSLPQGIYYLKSLPVKFLPFDYAYICLCAWLLTLLSSIYPAFYASRQEPTEGLRLE